MRRTDFPKPVKRDALRRSGGVCEATGALYGLKPGERCANKLAVKGVQFDHVTADAIGGKPTLDNCICACLPCHRHKTAKHDTPVAAKTKRQRDKNDGIRKRSQWPQGRKMGARYEPNVKRLEDL